MLKESWKTLLQQIVSLIQEYQKPENIENSRLADIISSRIRNTYGNMAEAKETEPFHDFLYKDFEGDPQLYTLLLSVIYKCTRDELCLRKGYQFLTKGNMELFYSLGISHQLDYECYTNPDITVDYKMRRALHKLQVEQMEKLLAVNLPYIPLKDRNQNRVLVMSNQLLDDVHAPTRNLKDLCFTLQEMGKDVKLAIAVQSIRPHILLQSWFKPILTRFFPKYAGDFAIGDQSRPIHGKQIVIDGLDIQSMLQMVEEIYKINPLFIWYQGGTSVFTDVLRSFTTVVSMPFTAGYACSEAQIMIEHTKDIRTFIGGFSAFSP